MAAASRSPTASAPSRSAPARRSATAVTTPAPSMWPRASTHGSRPPCRPRSRAGPRRCRRPIRPMRISAGAPLSAAPPSAAASSSMPARPPPRRRRMIRPAPTSPSAFVSRRFWAPGGRPRSRPASRRAPGGLSAGPPTTVRRRAGRGCSPVPASRATTSSPPARRERGSRPASAARTTSCSPPAAPPIPRRPLQPRSTSPPRAASSGPTGSSC